MAKLPKTLYVRRQQDGNDGPYLVAAATMDEAMENDGPDVIGVYELVKTVSAKKIIQVS